MKKFDEWLKTYNGSNESFAFGEAAFKAGMLAAADIALDVHRGWTGPIGVAAGKLAEERIRKAAEED